MSVLLRLFPSLRGRLIQQRGRGLLSVAGIALGVALGFTVHLINGAALNEFSLAVRSLAGEADLEITGGRSGFPESVYPVLARIPGVAVASPMLDLDVGVADVPPQRRRGSAPGTIRLLGIDSLRAIQVQPALFADEPQRLFDLMKPDTVLLSPAAATAFGLNAGDKLALLTGPGRIELEVAGLAKGVPGVVALTDLATSQWRLQKIGTLNRVDLRLLPGADLATVRAQVAAVLPAGAQVARIEELEEQGASLSRAYRVNLNVLALVALFTGGFLVFSAQALEVTRRRSEHGLLRVLGITRGELVRLVIAEAILIGTVGSALGLALGYALANAAVRAAGADLGAGMFRGMTPQIGLAPMAASGFFVAGIAIALVAGWLPALDAARAAPARSLKSGDEQQMFEKLVTPWPGLMLIATGAGFAQLGPVRGIPLFGYSAIACVLIGGILLMPRSVAAFLVIAGVPRSVPLGLALSQLRGAPGQAMVSLSAIVASFALMVAMALMVASFRGSVDEWLNAVLPADFYLRTSHRGDTVFLDPEFVSRVRSSPDIVRAEFLRSDRITLDPSRPAIALIARDLPGGAERSLPLLAAPVGVQPGDPPRVWVSEAIEAVYGYRPGMTLNLPIGGKSRPFVVGGVWRDYARQHGAIVIDRAEYARLTGDDRVNDAALWLRPGVTEAKAESALRQLPGGALPDMSGPGEIRSISLKVFDRSFAVTYALEAVAVVVGLFGLSSSLGAIVLARKREFGMLRHIGMTRGQIGAMLAFEGGLLASFGAAAGLAVGWVIGYILIRVVNRQSFNWGMDVHPPYGLLAMLTLVMIALAALTAFWSGREAMGMGPVRAVREDW